MANIAGLQKNVGLLNWAAGALFVGGITGFLILDDRISNRISPVAQGVTDIKIEQARQGANIEQLLKRVENNDDILKPVAGTENATVEQVHK